MQSILLRSSLLRSIAVPVLSITLASCAMTGGQPGEPEPPESLLEKNIIDTQANYKYAAWRPDNTQNLEAINVLLDESDKLIKSNAYDEAADKLERVLRIKPQYAPAWSRLSWIALQSDKPSRSVEMAKRSNSFAQSDSELLLLNWSLIRSASQQLNDEATYQQAEQKIDLLKI